MRVLSVICLSVFLFVVGCVSNNSASESKSELSDAVVQTQMNDAAARPVVVTAQDVLLNIDTIRQNTLIVDVRPRDQYALGHLPGAVNLPTNDTFDTMAGEFKILKVSEMDKLLGAAGVRLDQDILLVDSGEFRDTARMFWILESHGHRRVKVLDGGMNAWIQVKGPLSTEPHVAPATQFVSAMVPDRMATKLSTRSAIDVPDVVIIDARPVEEFKGLKVVEGRRAGHIPTALSVPWTHNLSENGQGYRLRSKPELEAIYQSALSQNQRAIVYCNKGKQSAVGYLTLRYLGYPVGAYDGSYWEWGADEQMPIVNLSQAQ